MTTPEHVDVLVIGAGLSGIGAAAHLARLRPHTTYAVLERRDVSGGTWDLFRYPGVRSDSDMFTLGYRFKPWEGRRSLADGESILAYLRETAREHGVDRHIRYGHRVVHADWSSAEARWSVTVMVDGESRELTCDFLWACSGYYDYDQGYTPDLPGLDRFEGQVVHPQHWPEDLDHGGRRVVVIGSGATAVTLVPALATSGAGHVTMLQRSPTYVLSQPAEGGISPRVARLVGSRATHALTRAKSVAVQILLYQLSRRRPDKVRAFVRSETRKLLPEGYDVDTHFKPVYDPWDQRMCLVPDGDLFHAISDGSASVVTDTIRTFTPRGIELTSGEHLDADLVVTATGLNLQVFGGASLSVDGVEVEPSKTLAYRALMLSGVPNFAFTIGYTNASWTLKADLVSEYVCRLLAHAERRGLRTVVPVPDESVEGRPLLDIDAGYVRRVADTLPRQGTRAPWALHQNYVRDAVSLRRAPMDDGVLRWS